MGAMAIGPDVLEWLLEPDIVPVRFTAPGTLSRRSASFSLCSLKCFGIDDA